MNKAQTMSLDRISTIPAEVVLYQDTQAHVDLLTFDQYPEIQLTARWDSDRTYGRGDEKLDDKVYVWAPPKKETPGLIKSPWMGRPRRNLLNGATGVPHLLPVDVREVSKLFFEIADPEQGLRFFTKYGIFGQEHRNTFAFLDALSFADLLQWQELLKKCRLTEPSGWNALSEQYARLRNVKNILDAPELSIGLESPIRIRLLCECARDVIIAGIYLEKLANLKSSMCQRPDCGVVFNHESQHQRKYCSSDCAHLEAVRRNRTKKEGR